MLQWSHSLGLIPAEKCWLLHSEYFNCQNHCSVLEPPCKLDTFNAFWWKGVYCCCWIFWQVPFSIVGTWKTALTAFAEHLRSSCIMSYWRVFLQQHCSLHFWCQLAINPNLYKLWKPKSGKRLMLWDWWVGPLAEKKKRIMTLMCKTSKNRTTNLVSEWINIWAALFWLKLSFLFFYTYIRNLMPLLKLSVEYTQKLLQFFFFILFFAFLGLKEAVSLHGIWLLIDRYWEAVFADTQEQKAV